MIFDRSTMKLKHVSIPAGKELEVHRRRSNDLTIFFSEIN
jgi:hypothetical protein